MVVCSPLPTTAASLGADAGGALRADEARPARHIGRVHELEGALVLQVWRLEVVAAVDPFRPEEVRVWHRNGYRGQRDEGR